MKISFFKDGKSRNHKDASLFTLAMNDVVYIHLISEKDYEDILGKYTLTFTYHDIMDVEHTQLFPFEFYQEGKKYMIPVAEYDQDSLS